ncbi:MAG: hypothetical protein SFW35_10205 [Chitinophagales bacterium]|nr:hypothetical protein [Chitinophagales bacterium]
MKHFLLAICTICCLQLTAQTLNNFSKEPEAYIKELSDLLNATKREDSKLIAETFANNFKSGKITPAQIEEVAKTSNIMLGKKMRAYPHYNEYITAINNFAASGQPGDLFSKWSSMMNAILIAQKAGSTTTSGSFLDFSNALFSKNAIYSSDARTWKASSTTFVLEGTNDQPKITFPVMDLIGIVGNDSFAIKNTKGTFYPLDNKWVGQGGTVNWSKAGLKPEEVYAQIKNYTIDVTKSEYRIDSVQFHHAQLFKEPLLGTYTDKLAPRNTASNFPLFVSFRKDIKINDLGPNVKYEGGFALAGNEIMGTGDSTGKASLSFYQDNGKKVVQSWSKSIIIKKGVELSALDAETSLYMGQDSIYHPGMTLRYRMEKKELTLLTGQDGIAASPFYDSYHKQEIKADMIVWNLNDPEISIKMIGSTGKEPVTFTSTNYFSKGELEKWRSVTDYNPVTVMKMYADKYNTREIDAESLAKAMNPNYTENTIKRLLFMLVSEGYIFYDEDRHLVTVKDKVFNYVLANADRIDYDVLKFNSFDSKTNGKINLQDNSISLKGVPMITLSDSNDVRIFPGEKDSILIKKEQDIDFSNVVIAGVIDFEGSGFHFDYDSFKIDMTNLAKATINVPTGENDEDGDPIYVPVKSKIEGLTGFLEIDHPRNKSGRRDYPKYPIFTNQKKSYVYYYHKDIADSAYIPDAFYFELEPFTFDSLQNFDAYSSDLGGALISADIFPKFEEKLKIQRDLSLGFRRVTPEAGYDIYKGKGHFNDSIMLSNSGLQGKGKVKYLFTGFESDSILFAPDSLNAISDTFNMEKTAYQGYTYPLVHGKDNDIHWLPYGDSMYIRMRSTPFVMYEDGTSLKGNLLLTNKGLKGEGSFEFKEAVLTSKDFNFQSESLDADTMGMQIKSIDENRVTFNTPNVKGKVDFAKRIGEFKSNEKDIATEFTNNYYKTEINEFFWDMDANILDFKTPPGSEGAYFVSTKAGQDSLKFLGKRAIFNMSTSIIEVSSVPEIRVADASIIPDSGKTTIMPGGLLDTLHNAVVVADTSNKSHRIHDATIIIDSKKEYHGKGLYDYVFNKNKEFIAFDNINVKQDGEKKKATYSTVANTRINETDTFKLNHGIKYKGNVSLEANKRFLQFEGYAKLNLTDELLGETQWFAVKDDVNPDTVTLNFFKLIGDSGDTLFAGIGYAALDSVRFYPSLMKKLKNPDDRKTFEAKGVVQYDDSKKTYYIGEKNKSEGKTQYGNSLTYNTENNTVTAEGAFDLGLKLDPIKMLTTGAIVNELDSNKFMFNTMLAMKLPIDKTLIERFGADITTFSFDKPNAEYTSNQFYASVANTMDNEKAGTKAVEEIQKTSLFAKPKSLGDYNLIISNVSLLYDPYYQIFRSVGPITLSYIGEAGIHKQMTGFIEFGMRPNNDFFNIYFESTFDDWYFLSYANNTLQIGSNKEDFNKMMAAIPAEKRRIKLTAEDFFFYTIGTFQNMQAFLQRMNLIASGVRVEFDAPSEEQQLEDELELLKQELLEEENQDNPDESPVPDASDNEIQTPPAPKPMLKEMEEYDTGGKKKKGKGKQDESLYDYQNEPVTPGNQEEEIIPQEEPVVPVVPEQTEPEPQPEETEEVIETPAPEPAPVEEEQKSKKKKGKGDDAPPTQQETIDPVVPEQPPIVDPDTNVPEQPETTAPEEQQMDAAPIPANETEQQPITVPTTTPAPTEGSTDQPQETIGTEIIEEPVPSPQTSTPDSEQPESINEDTGQQSNQVPVEEGGKKKKKGKGDTETAPSENPEPSNP